MLGALDPGSDGRYLSWLLHFAELAYLSGVYLVHCCNYGAPEAGWGSLALLEELSSEDLLVA
jgi:hypothetical protein